MWLHWMTFLVSSLAIVLAGIRLAPYGEALARHTGIGQGWIGLIFLATLTSIPEMTTTVAASSIDAPNIALGNAFGSNLFNVVIVAILDVLLLGRGPFLAKVRPYHIISGSLAVLLTMLAMLGIALQPSVEIGGVSPISLLILAGYVVGVFLLYRAEKELGIVGDVDSETIPLRRAVAGFLACAAVIVTAGIFLVRSSKEISIATGLSASFMGAVLVAIVTSLPELATSIGALRIGAYDMIMGNLFGSNMFNILTVFFADLAFRGGPIYAGLRGGEGDQLVVAVFGVLLTVVAIIAIAMRPRRRILGIGFGSIVLLITYLGATAILISRGIQS